MSTIKNAIRNLDESKEALEEKREAVKALEELGKAKAEIFVRDIQNSLITAGEEKSNKTVPITFMVGNTKEVRAFAAVESKNIGEVVNESLAAFLNGKKETISKGVGNLISNALGIFLGNAEAASDTIESYYVATDGLSPVRIDVRAWYYSVTAQSITQKVEKVITVVATKSVIDVSRIDLGTFLYLYQGQFDANIMSKEELKKALDEASEIYNTFAANCSPKNVLRQSQENDLVDWGKVYEKTLAQVYKPKEQITHIVDIRSK